MSKTVLLVEDEPALAALTVDLLSSLGLRCLHASSGVHALTILSQEAVDLVLMDFAMPHLDGVETTRMIRTQLGQRDIPVIFLTAFDRPADRELALYFGANDYLVKPCDPHTMDAVLERWL